MPKKSIKKKAKTVNITRFTILFSKGNKTVTFEQKHIISISEIAGIKFITERFLLGYKFKIKLYEYEIFIKGGKSLTVLCDTEPLDLFNIIFV